MTSIRVADDAPDIVTAIQYMHRNLHHTEDFKFISKNGQEFTSHSLIIKMFSSVLAEKMKDPSCSRSIPLDVGDIAIENMIRFFYAEDLVFNNVTVIIETKRLADEFQIFELGRICITRLADISVDNSNVISVFKTSVEFNDTAKEDESLSLISENKETVFSSQDFITMKFEDVLEVFEKLRSRNFMTESAFFQFAIQWLETNNSVEKKDMLMSKINLSEIPLNDYLDITYSSKEIFNFAEIASALNIIRSSGIAIDNEAASEDQQIVDAPESYQQIVDLPKSYVDAGTNTETVTPKVSEICIPVEKYSNNLKKLTIKIVNETNEANIMNWPKRILITTQDAVSIRNIQCPYNDALSSGLIGRMKKSAHTFKNVGHLSYEGIHYMAKLLWSINQQMSPLQHIEAMKATEYFGLTDLLKNCYLLVENIVNYDPLFLDGLNYFKNLKDRCLQLLTTEPLEVLSHPNIIYCSGELVLLLLKQSELKICYELQLLLGVILWLQAKDRHKGHYRSALLNNIAFECLSTEHFKYVVSAYPEFFLTNEEVEPILAYKTAEGDENIKKSREKLPDWYTFKSRKYLLKEQ